VDFLRCEPPLRAFVLHSYGGSADLVREFVQRGAFFSFSPYFLHERKARQRDVFQGIPLDRLLVETDAPDMAPPLELNEHPLAESGTGVPLNHPLNLILAYRALAETRGVPMEELTLQMESNFAQVFGA
jgi:TatD DNase family protein